MDLERTRAAGAFTPVEPLNYSRRPPGVVSEHLAIMLVRTATRLLESQGALTHVTSGWVERYIHAPHPRTNDLP
jgi:hypothetical protein